MVSVLVIEACLSLLFIVILTTVSKVTSLHCSDQQLPSSGDGDLQQVTTLQYCLVDNCTIKRIDTGEEVDIVYTTDSLIVTTPTDGRTSVVIALITQSLSWYIIAIHLMFKELQTLFGKLLMLYNIAVVFLSIGFAGIFIRLLHVALNSLAFCYGTRIGYMLSVVTLEALGTSLLHHFVVTLRCCYKLRPGMSEQTSQHHFREYTMATTFLVLFLIISYNAVTGN